MTEPVIEPATEVRKHLPPEGTKGPLPMGELAALLRSAN
ncbi:protein of unknown function [Streptomyces sp. KY75]|nr:protein of unknown function [Streptomyces sp. KY70]CAD5979631.1 protein of unknown function [Streptomyces sp. KY75]